MLTLSCVVLAVMLSRPNADQGFLQGLLVVATAMLVVGCWLGQHTTMEVMVAGHQWGQPLWLVVGAVGQQWIMQ